MNLQEFVTVSLTQIVDGITEAQKKTKEKGAIISPAAYSKKDDGIIRKSIYDSDAGVVQLIEFDVAVSVQESENVKGGIGIFAGAVGIGTQAQAEGGNATANRIKFSIPICLPTSK